MKMEVKGFERKVLTPTFICLWLIMFLIEVVKSALLVTILPVYMGSVLGLSAFAIGVSLSLQYIGDNFFRSPAGWLVERVGFRLTMLAGLVLSLGAVALIAWGERSLIIGLGCTLLGVGTAPLWPCVLMGITEMTEGKQNFGTAMGIIQMSTLGGTGVGPVVINLFIRRSYEGVFWILLGCLAVALLLAMLLPGVKLERGRKEEALKKPSVSAGGLRKLGANLKQTFTEIRNNLQVSRLLYPALFLQSFAIGLLTPIITLYIRTVLMLSPAMFSVLLVTGGAVTVLGLIPIGKLADKYGTRLFLNTGFLLAFLSILGLALFRDMTAVWILVICIGASYAFILPTWDTMIAKQLPEGEKGTVWGFFLTIQGCGMVVGPVISGKLWDLFGPSAPFLVSAGSMGALLLIHLWISRPGRRTHQGPAIRQKTGGRPLNDRSGPKARLR
ncbi:MFS transporter [Paenibacillus physcomitrellae]|uniref:Multidrug resistance protein MdtG n=1 Tax=Paenibacillus physcomitrellae TaxID=1619311 RepID=A0ABQ1FLL5_9BACL|nr:MFS transporter [Paenibacillus physcomitrellae]GGA21520.1 multidrug resistance protein MdtG [Paenibacillus physcomitrellae]